jgi:hypothetical protein
MKIEMRQWMPLFFCGIIMLDGSASTLHFAPLWTPELSQAFDQRWDAKNQLQAAQKELQAAQDDWNAEYQYLHGKDVSYGQTWAQHMQCVCQKILTSEPCSEERKQYWLNFRERVNLRDQQDEQGLRDRELRVRNAEQRVCNAEQQLYNVEQYYESVR